MVSCPNCQQQIEDDIQTIQKTESYRCKNCGKKLKFQTKSDPSKSKKTLGTNFEDLDLGFLDKVDSVPVKNSKSKRSPDRKPAERQSPDLDQTVDVQEKKSQKKKDSATKAANSSLVRETDESKPSVGTQTEIPSERKIQPLASDGVEFVTPNKESKVKGKETLFINAEGAAESLQEEEPYHNSLPTVVLGDPGRARVKIDLKDDGREDSMSVWGIDFLAQQPRSAAPSILAGELKKKDQVKIEAFSCPICDSPLMAKTGKPGESVICQVCESTIPVPENHQGLVSGSNSNQLQMLAQQKGFDDAPLEIPDESSSVPDSGYSAKDSPPVKESETKPQVNRASSTYDPDAELTLVEPAKSIGEGGAESGDNLGTAFLYGTKELEILEDPVEDQEISLAPLEEHQKSNLEGTVAPNIPSSPALDRLRGPIQKTSPLGNAGDVLDLDEITDLDLPEIAETSEALENRKSDPPPADSKTEQSSPQGQQGKQVVAPSGFPPVQHSVPPAFPGNSGKTSSQDNKEQTESRKESSIFERGYFYNWKAIATDPVMIVGMIVNSFLITLAQIFSLIGDQFREEGMAVFLLINVLFVLPIGSIAACCSGYLTLCIAEHDYRTKKKTMTFDFGRFQSSVLLVGLPISIAYLGLGGLFYLLFGPIIGSIAGCFFAFVLAPFILIPSLFTGKPFQFQCDEVTLARIEDPKEFYLIPVAGGVIWVFCFLGIGLTAVINNSGLGVVSIPIYAAFLSISHVIFSTLITRFLDVTEEISTFK